MVCHDCLAARMVTMTASSAAVNGLLGGRLMPGTAAAASSPGRRRELRPASSSSKKPKSPKPESEMVYEPNWSRQKPRKVEPEPVELPSPEAIVRAERASLLKQVQGLRDRGLSHQQIATALEVRKVSRPSGRPWTDKAVASILASIARKASAND